MRNDKNVKTYKTQRSGQDKCVRAHRMSIQDGFLDIGGVAPTGRTENYSYEYRVAIGVPGTRVLVTKEEWEQYKKLVDEWFENPFCSCELDTIPFK